MNRIDRIFSELRERGDAGLMPFLTGGYPSLEGTEAAIEGLGDAGASVVEIGFPFSDPIADGPVIASSMFDALAAGVTPVRIFEMIERVRDRTDLGLIAMVSVSIVRKMGVDRFLDRAAEAGFDGLIVPDLDYEDAPEFAQMAGERGLIVSMLVAPTTTEERLEGVVRGCTGFVYVLSRVGVTGESSEMSGGGLSERLAGLRRLTDLPLAVGFGISTAEQVARVTEQADAAIVGSALVRNMGDAEDAVGATVGFVSRLADGLRRSDQR